MKIKAVVPGHGIILHLQLLRNNRLKQFCKKLTRMNYVIFNILMDPNNLSVFFIVWQSDVRRGKKIKVPILWVLENTSGVCLSSLKCKSHPPKQIYALWRKHPRGEGALPYMGHVICLCCGKGHGFEVGYQFSPVNVTLLYSQCDPWTE